MAWIESHQSLAKHRKTLRAAGRLQVDRATLIGHLHLLWWWGLDNAGIDGELGDVTAYEIALAAEWPGDPEAFVEALVDAGFIDRDESGLRLHDWYDYAGKLNERRERERQRSRQRRAADQRSTVQRPSERPPQDDGPTDGTKPNLTVPNHNNPPIVPPCTTEEREILGVLKAVDGYPFDFARDLEHIRALAVEFPQVDLLAEARRWAAYKRDKPLKPKSNPRLQFRNWCEKAMEFGRARKQQEVIRDDREYEALFRR